VTSTGAKGATIGAAAAVLDGRLILEVDSTRVSARTRNCTLAPGVRPLEIVTEVADDAVVEIKVDHEVPFVDLSTR
jgi:hypothetical protein